MADTQPQLERQEAEDRTIYNASPKEIFWKNFLAGVARGFGLLLVQIVGYAIIVGLFASFIWPVVKPWVGSLGGITQSLETTLNRFDSLQQNSGNSTNNNRQDNTY